jgi:hypothetical protein
MTRSFVNKWWRKGDIRHSQVYSSRALTSSPGGTQEPDVVSEQHEQSHQQRDVLKLTKQKQIRR